jgi:hypothetical protein
MKPHIPVALAATLAFAAPGARAAENAQGPQGESFASIAKLPDWTGVWALQNFNNPGRTNDALALKPEYAAQLEKTRAINNAGGDVPSPTYHCVPNGFPMIMAAPLGTYEFLMSPGMVTITLERNNETRRIVTSRREHPANLARSFYGDSIGHWENGTLAVDTVGMYPKLQLFYGFVGAGDTDVTERMSTPSPGLIHIETEIKDSAFTKPYTYARDYKRQPGWAMMEDYCAQNNRDVNADTGLQTFNPTPPPVK